ncbi:MAG TPA: hypothetical protein VK304_04725 [Thermoleophilaceae bacterium]|nr:hypothetical protein [Thermoleophilaceae bacterium]
MDVLAIVAVALGAAILLLFVGGYLARRRHDRRYAGTYARNLEEADSALETARAADRGWDREVLEQAARRALAAARPGWEPARFEIVLVDDRPGVTEDRAHLLAMDGDERVRVVLARQAGGHWSAQVVG